MNNKCKRLVAQFVIGLLLVFSIAQLTPGYSVLTHEAIIDSAWDKDLKPLLLTRFSGASAEQLREARAYAYGGAIIQDMGYYPFGSKFFTDLTHYVRSGDFVEALIRQSQNLNEYAFALGALGHYCADNSGHPIAVNASVPVIYPKLRQKYGNEVTYDQNPAAHIKIEFGIDVAQVAQGHYAPESYHDFVGFKVSEEVLERAFKETYGIELKSLFASLDLAVGTYRYSVSTVIPRLTKVAWETKREDIEKQTPGITREEFLYTVSNESYGKEWGNKYKKPGIVAKIMAGFIRVVPKVGPFKAFAFKPPTPETQKLFLESFNTTLKTYRQHLGEVRTGELELQNKDFDTGELTRAGEYPRADKAYAKILEKLAGDDFKDTPPELRENILAFYGDTNSNVANSRNSSDWRKTQRALAKLKGSEMKPSRAGGQ